jgi:hypothetical protein
MAVSRRRFVLLATPGLAAAAVAYPGTASAAPAYAAEWIPAADLGVTPTNGATANRVNLVAALTNSTVCAVFPPGDYLIDNGTDALIAGFGGQLVFQPGARLVFTDNTKSGIIFDDAVGPTLYGLNVTFVTEPPTRVTAEECVLFRNVTDPYLEDVRINGSAAAGLLFYRCVRPTVVGALITNTRADGLHFANCQDGRADRITTVDTGDDGVAFVNYASGPAHTGGLGTHLSVTRSLARGIAVVGQSGVTIRDSSVHGTERFGLYCASETGIRVPTDVWFERIRVYQGGAWQPRGLPPRFGVTIDGVGTVTMVGITVEEPGTRGVSAIRGGAVTLTDAIVRKAPEDGFNLQDGTYQVDRLTADDTGGVGFYATGNERVEYGTITVRNTAKTARLKRAVTLENNAYVVGERIWVYDTQAAASGYIVGAYGTQRGNLGLVVDRIASRDVSLENVSGLGFSRL